MLKILSIITIAGLLACSASAQEFIFVPENSNVICTLEEGCSEDGRSDLSYELLNQIEAQPMLLQAQSNTVLCHKEAQIFVITHAWKYGGFVDGIKRFNAYTEQSAGPGASQCLLLNEMILSDIQYNSSLLLPNSNGDMDELHRYSVVTKQGYILYALTELSESEMFDS